jgi:predicted secreted protein
MGWLSGILVYLVVWWLVIFMVLPWGVKPPENPEPGHATSAPDRPMLWRKVAITSVITAVVWVIIYLAIENSWVSFRP